MNSQIWDGEVGGNNAFTNPGGKRTVLHLKKIELE